MFALPAFLAARRPLGDAPDRQIQLHLDVGFGRSPAI
jgi:hypothetical protein